MHTNKMPEKVYLQAQIDSAQTTMRFPFMYKNSSPQFYGCVLMLQDWFTKRNFQKKKFT